jgi:hypothetical protein
MLTATLTLQVQAVERSHPLRDYRAASIQGPS